MRSLRRLHDGAREATSRRAAQDAAEASRLRARLAAEGCHRLRLLGELQDVRGTVRCYCCPMRPASANTPTTGDEGESVLVRVVLLDSIALWLSPLSNFYLSHSTSAELERRGGRGVKVKNSFRTR